MRLYDAELGRFTSVDPLWGLYEGLQPYQYAGNSPVGNLDASGLLVQAVDECAQSLVRSSIESAYRDKVVFDENGVLNTSMIVEAASGTDASSNVYRLAELAKASETVSIEQSAAVVAYRDGEVGTLTLAKLNNKGKEVLGLTLFENSLEQRLRPLASKPFHISTDDKIRVVVRDDYPRRVDLTRAQVAAHDLYLHAYYYLLFKYGENVSPIHAPSEQSSDRPASPTIVDTDQDMIESNAIK